MARRKTSNSSSVIFSNHVANIKEKYKTEQNQQTKNIIYKFCYISSSNSSSIIFSNHVANIKEKYKTEQNQQTKNIIDKFCGFIQLSFQIIIGSDFFSEKN